MKLTANSQMVLNFVRDNGGRVSIKELAEGLGKTPVSVSANVTDLGKKKLATRVKEHVGEEDITYVVLTDEGLSFEPTEE